MGTTRRKRKLIFTILLGLFCSVLMITCGFILSDQKPQTASAATTLTADEQAATVGKHDGTVGGNNEHLNIRTLPDNDAQMGGGSYFVNEDTVIKDTLLIDSGAFVGVCLNGHKLTMGGLGPMFKIINGGALTIYDCEGGGMVIGNGSDSCIVVEGKNDSRSSTFGINGGVLCEGGGTNGGGVYVGADGKFTMNGGVIKNNKASNGSGVYCKGTMIINGGIITDNTIDSGDGGGIWCSNGGIVTVNGGIIRNNTLSRGHGGGIFVGNGTLNITGGLISKNSAAVRGGGIYLDKSGTVTLSGGKIQENKAYNGGGVFASTTINMGGNVVIQENILEDGKINNVTIDDSSRKINIIAPIKDGFDIGITSSVPGVITSGYKTTGKIDPTTNVKITSDAADMSTAASLAGDEIALLQNNHWTTELKTGTYVYGSDVTAPTAAAAYGAVEYSYSDSEGGTFAEKKPKNKGSYYVKATVPRTETYAGIEATVPFEITAKPLTKAMVESVDGTFTYTGAQHTPAVTVEDGSLLTTDDYEISYEANVNAGAGSVTVIAKGNYRGTIEQIFTIDPATITASVSGYSGTYDKTAHDAAAEQTAVTVNDQTATWTYSTDNDIYSETIPQFKNAGTYKVYYKVNAPNHIEYSGTFTVEIAKATVSAPTIGDKVYTGEAQTADVTVSELYEVTQNDGGTNVGEYDLILTLTDHANYKWAESTEISGENSEIAMLKFVITKAANEWTEAPQADNIIYGESVAASGLSKFGELAITYTTETGEQLAAAPTAAGSYKAIFTVEGTADYSGMNEEVSFTVLPKEITVTIESKTSVYGEEKIPLTFTLEEGALAYEDTAESLNIILTKEAGIDAKTYAITGECANANYKVIFVDGTYTITKATYDTTDLAFEGKTVTYNGEAHSLEVTGLPAGVEVTYINNDKTNAGTYEVTARFAVDANHNEIADMTATLAIEKANYDTTDWIFAGKTVTYNGETHSLEVTGVPAGVDVTYINNGQTNADTYEVTAKFTVDENHNGVADMTAVLTINKAVYDMSGIVFDGKEFTYDGTSHELSITGTLPDGIEVVYENNGKTNASEYTVTAKFAGDADNYELIADMTATLTINKATYDMSGAAWDYTDAYTYDGTEKNVTVTGLPAGVTVGEYADNAKTAAGTYTAKAILNYDAANYNAPELAELTWTINKAKYDMSNVKFANAGFTYDGKSHEIKISGTLPAGVTVTYVGNGKTEAGEYNVTAKFVGDADNYEPIADMTAKLTITKAAEPEPTPDPDKGGCNGCGGVFDGGTLAGITFAVLAFAVVIAVRKFRSKK